MNFVLDSLQMLAQPMATTTLNEPTLLVVNTYTVCDNRYNVCKQHFIILSDWYYIVRALLNVLINGNESVLQFGNIIKINHYNMVVATDTCILMINNFYIKYSNADQLMVSQIGSQLILITSKIQSQFTQRIKYGLP